MTAYTFTAEVREGRESVRLNVGDASLDFTSAQVSELIVALSQLRATMLPAVALDVPTKITFEENPKYDVKVADPAAGIYLGFRHAGLGWIYAHLPQSEAIHLATGLQQLRAPSASGSGAAVRPPRPSMDPP